ncbi:MAG TPA: hypothetical protein VLL08_13955 [Kineosporiaceae bacterium]|nr:hypothetical protein [Kineosporiaceae bacterium]
MTTPEQHASAGDQLDLRLLRGSRGHGGLVLTVRVLPTALLLTAVQLLLTGSRLSRSWWYQDDLNILARAANRTLSPDQLFSNYNGHLIPGTWVIAWALDRVAPLQWWPAAVLTLIFVAATDLMMLALLRRLFGNRPAILVPYAMFCSTSLVLTSTLWWAAALEWLPLSLSMITALWFHVGYLRTRRRTDALGVLLAILFGLAFFEKALVTLLVLALFTVCYATPGSLWRRPWRGFRLYWGYWLVQAVLAGGYLWLYLTRTTIDTGPASKVSDVVEVTRLMILETLLPSLIGGPLNWYTTPGSNIGAWPHPSSALVILAAAMMAAAVIGSLLVIRGSWRAWLLLAVYLGISVTLVARVRLGFVGPWIGRDQRYLTDLAVMVPLCLGLAFLPLRDGLLGATVAAPVRPSRVAVRRQELIDRAEAWLARREAAAAATAAVVVLAMVVGGIYSGEKFMNSWSTNPGQTYFDNLNADLRAHSGPVYLFGDETVPELVMMSAFMDDRQIRHVTKPLPVRPQTGDALPYFSVVDPLGHLHDGMVRGSDVTLDPPVCATSDRPAIVKLPITITGGKWKVRLAYNTNRQTTARVALGTNQPVTMRLERGLHEVFVNADGNGANQLRLDGIDPGSTACLGAVTVGFPVIKS